MVDTATLAGYAGAAVTSGALTWIGNAVLQRWMKKDEAASKQLDANVQIAHHRDQFVIELLATARTEAAAARQEATAAYDQVARFREIEIRLGHFDEALDHISRLLAAEGTEERKAATRMAKAFMTRMHRLQEARGTMANEAQIERSKAALPNEIDDLLKKLP